MTATYRITFTPMEPYFFGNEKTFRFTGEKLAGQFDSPYYIRSEILPAQTTLFGAIRYLLLNNRDPYFQSYPTNYEERIGPNSFSLKQTKKQNFGIISKMSPVFLQNAGDIYVKTPFDHKSGESVYTPFCRATLTAPKSSSKREYAEDYDVKAGISDSYMNIDTRGIIDGKEIFDSVTRVGIDKKKHDEAFFKKEFRILKAGWSFGIYLTLDFKQEETLQLDPVVFLGQNKAAFRVEYVQENVKDAQEENQIENRIRAILPPHTVYCFGDTYVKSDVYQNFTFAATLTRDHRMYETLPDSKETESGQKTERIRRDNILYKLLRAGSVFWFDPELQNITDITEPFNHLNAQTIGMNSIIIKE